MEEFLLGERHPGTRETDLLRPLNAVQEAKAVPLMVENTAVAKFWKKTMVSSHNIAIMINR